MGRCAFALVIGCLTSFASTALGQGREGLAKLYLDHTRDHQAIYQSTPISHIVPDFNTITYALALARSDIEITPEHKYSKEKLHLEGYQASPYLALSLRHIGLGFSVEMGQKTAAYSVTNPGHFVNQRSQLDYSAVGIFLFNAPLAKSWKNVKPGIVLGGRMISARHGVSSTKHGASADEVEVRTQEMQKFSYGVFAYEAGFNINFQAFRNVGIIPWIDYLHHDSRKAEAIARDTWRGEMKTDVQLFWQDQPRTTYGLDFSMRIMQFEARLGGIFGLIASYGSDVDYIEDKSVTLSFSFDQKGH